MEIRSDEELIRQKVKVKRAIEQLLQASESLTAAIALRMENLGQGNLADRRAEQIEAAEGSIQRARAHLNTMG